MSRKSFLRYVGEIFQQNGNTRITNTNLVYRVHKRGYDASREQAMAELTDAISDGYLTCNSKFRTCATGLLEKRLRMKLLSA